MNRKPYPSDVSDDKWVLVDQKYTARQVIDDTASQGLKVDLITLPDVKNGFVLLQV